MNFDALPLQETLLHNLQALNFTSLTPVQEAVIPRILRGKDVMVQSQTGSGKTHSFMIPIIERLDGMLDEVQAVITAPSRELADQLYQVAKQLSQDLPQPLRIENYVGGTDKQRQLDKLGPQNQPHLVIGTPGRIFDLMKENALWVQHSRMLVIDEADMTLDLGFLPLVDEIASRMPRELQMMVFSATIPQALEVFLAKYMDQPERIHIEAENLIAKEIHNYLLNTKGRDRKALTYELLTMGHPFLALVFANTKQYADELVAYLREKGLKVAKIHGDVESRERKRIMKQIRNLEFQYVVATDLAARGIDIPGISLVINTEVPKELDYFIHRVGRTGRNQLEGDAITFITPEDDPNIQRLEARGIEFTPVEWKHGRLVETYARTRRKTRRIISNASAATVQKIVGRRKKQPVKPGYKRKLQAQIKANKKQSSAKKKKS